MHDRIVYRQFILDRDVLIRTAAMASINWTGLLVTPWSIEIRDAPITSNQSMSLTGTTKWLHSGNHIGKGYAYSTGITIVTSEYHLNHYAPLQSYLHASSAEQSVMLTRLPKKPFLSKLSCKIKASFQVVFSKNLILTSACTVPWESGLSLDRLKDTRSCCLLI